MYWYLHINSRSILYVIQLSNYWSMTLYLDVTNRWWNAAIYHFCFRYILSCINTIFHCFFCFLFCLVSYIFCDWLVHALILMFTCFREYPCYPQYSALYVSDSISNQTLECSCSSGVQRCPKGLSCLGLSNNVASLSFL